MNRHYHAISIATYLLEGTCKKTNVLSVLVSEGEGFLRCLPIKQRLSQTVSFVPMPFCASNLDRVSNTTRFVRSFGNP